MDAHLASVIERSPFGVLGSAAREHLVAASRRVALDPHTPLIVEDQPTQYMYLLLSGAIRVFHLSPAGFEVVVMFCRAPALFGEIETVLRIPHIENVSTLERSELLLIPNAVFLTYLDDDVAFTRLMVADVCAKLAMASHNQKALAFQDTATRLATLLISYAAFDGTKRYDGIELRLAVTQDDMAHALGITRRAVSKTITTWLERGLISRRGGHYVLHDLEQLTVLAAAAHIGLGYDSTTGLTIISPESQAPWVARSVMPGGEPKR